MGDPNFVKTRTYPPRTTPRKKYKHRVQGFPPMRCNATKKNGVQCRSHCIRGLTVCGAHRGNFEPNIKAADRRMTLAQLLGNDPRPPWVVLLDAVQTSDALLTHYRKKIQEDGGEDDEDLLQRLLDAVDRAAKLSKLTLDAGISERMTRQYEFEGAIVAESVAAAMDAVFAALGLDPARELELRNAALAAGAAKLSADEGMLERGLGGTSLSRDVAAISALKSGNPTPGAVDDRKRRRAKALTEHSERTGNTDLSDAPPEEPPWPKKYVYTKKTGRPPKNKVVTQDGEILNPPVL